MQLEPGLIFRVAPRFHCPTGWAERLQLNGGAAPSGDTLRPRADWRSASVAELALLAPSALSDDDPLTATQCALLTIPAHLRQGWWDEAEGDTAGEGASPGYDALVAELLALLAFKGLSVPGRCAAAVLINRPGQTSTRLDDAGQLAGLRFGSLVPAGAAHGAGNPLAVINLGDEFAHVVVLNLAMQCLQARLGGAAPDTVLTRFYAHHAAYPLVRVRLDPGEGLWWSTPAPAFDGWTVDKSDLDALLVLQD